MFGENVTISQAITVCLFSISVVFLVLLSIALLITLTAKILHRKTPEKKVEVALTPVVTPEPKQEEDSALTAIITAAVASYLNKSSSQFIIRSIQPIQVESEWSRVSRTNSLQ